MEKPYLIEGKTFTWLKPIPPSIFKQVSGIVQSFRQKFPEGALFIALMFDVDQQEFYVAVPRQSCQSLSINWVNFSNCLRKNSLGCGFFTFPFDAYLDHDLHLPHGLHFSLYVLEKRIILVSVKFSIFEYSDMDLRVESNLPVNLSQTTKTSLTSVEYRVGNDLSLQEIQRLRKSPTGKFIRWCAKKNMYGLAQIVARIAQNSMNKMQLQQGFHLPRTNPSQDIKWDEIYDYAGGSGMFIGIPVHTKIYFQPQIITLLKTEI